MCSKRSSSKSLPASFRVCARAAFSADSTPSLEVKMETSFSSVTSWAIMPTQRQRSSTVNSSMR